MLKGKKEVVQNGVIGIKEITYKVTYENDKEVSREIVSEKVTKEAVDQIEKVGTSDFNMNKDILKEIGYGPVCTEDKLSDTYGDLACDDETYADLANFTAVKINDTYYITSIEKNGLNVFKGLLNVTKTDG